MSITQAAVLFDQRLPVLDQVEALGRELGYDLSFPEKPDLRIHDGWLAAIFEGKETGFESSYHSLDTFEPPSDEIRASGDRVLEMTTTGGDFVAGLFANVFLRVFCELADGGWWYLDNDEFYQLAGTTNAYFDEQIQSYRDHIANQVGPSGTPSRTL